MKNNSHHSEKTKQKMREAHLGSRHAKFTEEGKRHISEACKGRIPWNKGKSISLEQRKKLSESKKGKNQPHKPKYTFEQITQMIYFKNQNIEILSTTYRGLKYKIDIKCKRCGHIWSKEPAKLLWGQDCPMCSSKITSHGEQTIIDYLMTHNIKFETQKTFDNCKDKAKLRFDFYLPQQNVCIEFDGRHHFVYNQFWGTFEDFIIGQERDKLKDEFCESVGIKLIRIHYKQQKDIPNILNDLIYF